MGCFFPLSIFRVSYISGGAGRISETSVQYHWLTNGGGFKYSRSLRSCVATIKMVSKWLNILLVGGFNPFEKY